MKPRQGMLAVLLLVSLAQGADLPRNQFRFWKPIDFAPTKDEQIVAFPLDSDIYAATRGGFPDLRVIDDQSTQTPCQIEPDVENRQDQTRESVDTRIVSLSPNGDTLEVRIRLPDDTPPADGLTIDTPLTNYQCKVRISGSADGVAWSPLVADGAIFDFSRYMDVRNRDLALPKSNFREFKVTIEDQTSEKESPFKELTRSFRAGAEDQRTERTTIEHTPFHIDRISAWHVVTHQSVKQAITAAYPLADFESKEDPAGKQTLVTVRSHREPITRLVLETTSRNFSRNIVVETPNPPTDTNGPDLKWSQVTPIAQGAIFNFSYRNLNREELSIAFPEQRQEDFRIVINNEDNPPINVTGVKAEGVVYRVVFLAQPGKTYRVVYGSPNVDAPDYDAAAVLGTLRRDFQPSAATLGEQAANPGFAAEPALNQSHILDNWIFFGTAIGLMVVVLGWALFRAGKRLETQSTENSDHP